MFLECYGSEQATKHLLSVKYGVTCNLESFRTEAKRAANLLVLQTLPTCGAYNEVISCFQKNKSVDPCANISIKDCSGFEVALYSPEPKPCYLTVQLV